MFSEGQSPLLTAFVCTLSILVLYQNWGYVVQLRIWGWFLVWHELQLWAAYRLLLAFISNFSIALLWKM